MCFTQCWHRCSLDGSLLTSTYKFLFFRTHSQLPFRCFHFCSKSCSHHQIFFHSLPVHFRKLLQLWESIQKSLWRAFQRLFRLFFQSFQNSFRKLFRKLGWELRSSFLSRSFWKLFWTSFWSFRKFFPKFIWRLWSPFWNSIRKSFRKFFWKFVWVLWSSLWNSFRKLARKFIRWLGHQERLPGVAFRYYCRCQVVSTKSQTSLVQMDDSSQKNDSVAWRMAFASAVENMAIWSVTVHSSCPGFILVYPFLFSFTAYNLF